MLRFALLCGLVAAVAADCSHMDTIRVKTQWAEAYGDGPHRDSFGQALWRAVFKLEPDVADIFRRVNGDDPQSPEFRAHSARVLGSLDMTIALMDDPSAFQAQLAHLQGQHEERHVPAAYFGYFERALKEVVKAQLGHCYEDGPWHRCFDVIAKGILG